MMTYINNYISTLKSALSEDAFNLVPILCDSIYKSWADGSSIYICGNGGSAANANHIANDFLYGAGMSNGLGLRIESLSANQAVITCLANDIGYDKIYSEQLRVKGKSGDVLIVLSGSGNSSNILSALEVGNSLGMRTFALLGYDGGKALKLAQHPLHFKVDNMQICEDLQLIAAHMCMTCLRDQKVGQ